MRILIPILGFAPQGGYRVLSELANAWLRQGHECSFLAPATSDEPYFPTNAHILRCDRNGLSTDTRLEAGRTGGASIASLYAGLKRIGRDYNVVLANHCLTAWPVALAHCGLAKKFYYIQAHELDHYPITKEPIKHLLARASYLLSLRQISNSAEYRGAGIRPENIIPPGIDLSIFSSKENVGDINAQATITLGTVGRTEPFKGTATVLAAYRQLRQDDPRVRMKVAFGNVEPSNDLEILEINGDRELAAFYRSIDVLVVACRGQKGAPHYPVIESMASGTPVVHTGYYPGNNTNSWEAIDSTPDAVAQALRDLLAMPRDARQKRTKKARAIIERDLSWDLIAERFVTHFMA